MRSRSRLALWCALLLAGGAGCADRPRADRYVPPPDAARDALEAALKAWQGGSPPGKVERPGVAVYLVDNCRPPGQWLRGYKVLGEAPGEGPRCFAAKLLLEGQEEEQVVRFEICLARKRPLAKTRPACAFLSHGYVSIVTGSPNLAPRSRR